MAISADDDGRKLGSSCCSSCGTSLAVDQRYCLACGERRGAIPAAVAQWLSIVEPAVEGKPEAAVVAPPPREEGGEEAQARYMPAPRSAAIAVLIVLGFGVLLGGLTGPAAQSAGIAPIVLYSEAKPPPPAEPVSEPAAEATEPVVVAEAPAAVTEVPVEAESPEEPAGSAAEEKTPS